MWLTRRHLLILAAASTATAARATSLLARPPGPIALEGFDPVSYFLGAPEPGQVAFEVAWGGRTWRFARAANQAAFRGDPVRYAPRLGGFDPIGVLSGRLVDTDPSIFVCLPDGEGLARLYLLRSAEHRARLSAEPALSDRAERRWPDLRDQIERDFPD